MMLLGRNFGGLILKIKTADVKGFLADLKKQWDAFNPEGPLGYTFLDENFAKLYANEIRTQQIFSAFAIIAIIIASLGLFGLSAFVIEQRTKEIGIRKVLGASVQNVLLLGIKRIFITGGDCFYHFSSCYMVGDACMAAGFCLPDKYKCMGICNCGCSRDFNCVTHS